jgi:ATP-dependent DNA helicase DinG
VNGAGGGFGMGGVVPLGLIARWLPATADGDLSGGDLPGWFAELFGPALLPALADRRGECLYAACTHFRRCFVEHTIRRARGARQVPAHLHPALAGRTAA